MSKSDPNSAIFMEVGWLSDEMLSCSHHFILSSFFAARSFLNCQDSAEEVVAKIKKAFCPAGKVEGNPCVEYVRYMVLPRLGEFGVARSPENGGDKVVGVPGG